MPTLVGFGRFAALLEEQISEKISRRILSGDQGMIVWWSGAGVHVEPHSHANEQIVSMLKGKMEFRFGSEQRVCGLRDVVSPKAGIVRGPQQPITQQKPLSVPSSSVHGGCLDILGRSKLRFAGAKNRSLSMSILLEGLGAGCG